MCIKNKVFNLLHTAKKHYGFLRIWRLQNARAMQLNQQAGFTLIELLVVVGLIGIVALGTTSLLIEDSGWKMAIETERRWDKLHKAIVGESNQTLNGAPYVRSYVADMGRLPKNIKELFFEGDQPLWEEANLSGANVSLSGGWRGPYLYTEGGREYRDGWNNVDFADRDDGNAIDDDVTNFGWLFTLKDADDNVVNDLDDIEEATHLTIKSLGADDRLDGSEIDADFPSDSDLSIVNANEWLISDTPFTISFNKPVTVAQTGLELRLYRYVDGDIKTANSATFALAIGDDSKPESTLPIIDTEGNNLPAGRFAAVIWCTAVNPEVVYDGDCDTGNVHNPVYLTLTPYTTDVTIRWNLP